MSEELRKVLTATMMREARTEEEKLQILEKGKTSSLEELSALYKEQRMAVDIPEDIRAKYPPEIFANDPEELFAPMYMFDFRKGDSFYYKSGLSKRNILGMIFIKHLYDITHKDGMSLLMTVDGRHRSGKSRMWVTIGALLDRGFLKDMEKRIVTNAEVLLNLVNELDVKKIHHPVIIVDEAGNALNSGDWYEKMQKAIIKTLTVIGYLHPTIIFITTNSDLILSGVRKQAHMYVRVDRFDNKHCCATVYHLKVNPINRKQYYKRPRIRLDRDRYILARLFFPLPPEWLDERYRLFEEAMKPRLLREIHDDVMKADVKELKQMFDHEKAADMVAKNYTSFQNERQRKLAGRGDIKIDSNYIKAKLKCSKSDADLVKDMAERRIRDEKDESGKRDDSKGGVGAEVQREILDSD